MRRLALLLFATLVSTSVSAAPVPSVGEIDAAERPVFMRAVALLTQPDPSSSVQQLDRLLAEVPSPTKARGSIQLMRTQLLLRLGRESEAQLAVQESIRLLPDYSGPLFVASEVTAFGRNPGASADYFIRASRIDPDRAANTSAYNVFNLLRRLRQAGDEQKIEALTDRLVQINWVGDNLDGRSIVVRDAILLKLKRKDVAGARALVTELVDPSMQYSLLAQKIAEPIWGDIENWGGQRLEKQWSAYLREAKRRFSASNDLDDATDYLSALTKARKDQEAIATFLPIFMSEDRSRKDEPLLFGAVTLAGALARSERFDEQDALYEWLGRIWPIGSTTNALNLTANHAAWLMIRGDNDRALAMIDATLAAAVKAGDEVNADAIAGMHQIRACVLAKSGRGPAAAASAAQGELSFLVDPAKVAKMHLCLGQEGEAKKVVLRALSTETTRTEMLLALQPSNQRPIRSAFAEAEQKNWDKSTLR